MADQNFNTEGIDQLLKSLKHQPKIRVGILGSKDHRDGKNPSNATIGAAHEFGSTKLPQRSFLRVPLADKLNSYLQKAGILDRNAINDAVKSGSMSLFFKKIAIIAETVVLDAFDTGGFGKWKPSNMKNKKNQQTLVETTQLRNSITSEVIE